MAGGTPPKWKLYVSGKDGKQKPFKGRDADISLWEVQEKVDSNGNKYYTGKIGGPDSEQWAIMYQYVPKERTQPDPDPAGERDFPGEPDPPPPAPPEDDDGFPF